MSYRIGAVILAAGASTRLGRPKQTVLLHGETLLNRAVRTAREAGANEVVVVLGAFAEAVQDECDLRGCHVVLNPDWQTGMGSSIRIGVEALTDLNGVLVMTCDMPLVSADHLQLLSGAGVLSASEYSSGKGIPAFFPSSYFDALRSLDGSTTAKHLLQAAVSIRLFGSEMDVDTPADVQTLESLFAESI